MLRRAILVLILAVWLLPCPAVLADGAKEAAGLASARSWLAEVDEGRYAQSWEDAADYFKTAVGKERWLELMASGRKPLGQLISRKLLRKSYHTSLPGAPDGQYVVIQFETSFENKRKAVETVTPMLDKDGQWRVSGYFIK